MKSKGQDVIKRYRKFLAPSSTEWLSLESDGKKDDAKCKTIEAKNKMHEMLLSALQMPNLIVLAGSGTSLGETGGPSMADLWDHAMNSNGEAGKEDIKKTELAEKVITTVIYDEAKDGRNIELLLSRCEAYLEFNQSEEVQGFINHCKQVILEKCTNFLSNEKLDSHRTFLHRLSRRRVRDPRLKIFTTNYDLCFEKAAALQGLIAIDGFSFGQPRRFDPRFFGYDIVRRSQLNDEDDNYLEGVFHLLKIHGSVNWVQNEAGSIEERDNPDPNEACLIYPATAKYKQSYRQPHLEIVSQYLSNLRAPNTCLIVVGFGFNDDHLSEPILSAIESNPNMRVIVVGTSAERLVTEGKKYWKLLSERSSQGDDVWLINSSFNEFANMIPDLKSLTPAQQLEKAIRRMGSNA